MNRRNRLPRVALVLALLVLAAIVTGVAESAAKTVIPKRLTGEWYPRGTGPSWNTHKWMVSPQGKFVFIYNAPQHTGTFSRVTAHRLSISGYRPYCGTGTYRWNVARGQLTLTKIHDACKARVNAFAGTWLRYKG